MVIIYMALVVSMYILLFQNILKMQFQDHNVVQDFSFKEFLSFKFKIVFFFFDPKYFYEMTISCIIAITRTAQKIRFSITDFFSKCDQIRWKLQIWSHLLKKSVIVNFIFCAVMLQKRGAL